MLENNLQRAKAPPALKAGRYVISGTLGKGGNAGVYQAWDTRLRTWRAIKVLSHEFIRDDHVRARFAQEAATMARLDHPNLVQVYDISDDPFTPHIVMELCAGGSIIQWMKQHGAVPPRLALHVIRSTALGVKTAHEANITHRDIKPQNILIDHKGTIKLTDFGIARDEDNSLTQAGATMGTYAFMAPEQRHDSAQVDLRADIYSLGATLFTLVQVKTTTELFVAEKGDEVLAGIPDPVVDFILKACAYKPSQRYQSIDELVAALDDAMAKLPPDPDHAPLNALAKPLPDAPPTELSDLSPFSDLLKSLALNEDQPTFVDRGRRSDIENTTLDTGRTPEPERRVLPYYMSSPSRTDHGSSRPAPQGRPSYLDASSYVEEPSYSEAPPPPQSAPPSMPDSKPLVYHDSDVVEEEEEEPTVDQNTLILLGSALVMVFVVFAVFLYLGASNLNEARRSTLIAEATLVRSVKSAAPVIPLLEAAPGGAGLQQTFFRVEDAPEGEQGDAALAFADDLVSASAAIELNSVSQGLVDQVGSDAGQLRAARESWVEATNSIPGTVALQLGLGQAAP
jgi:serine/threonine protein kinase